VPDLLGQRSRFKLSQLRISDLRIQYTMSEDAGQDALTRLYQREMIKLSTVNNQLLDEIKAVLVQNQSLLQQNQVLLVQIDKNIKTLRGNSY
jgi:hypothetical protein